MYSTKAYLVQLFLNMLKRLNMLKKNMNTFIEKKLV